MHRREAMPPRAGSDRVAQVAYEPEPQVARAPAAGPAPSASPAADVDGARGDDPAATLERLATLRDKGLITADEYEAKKQHILERF